MKRSNLETILPRTLLEESLKIEHPLRGMCYVLAELIYHTGGKKAGLRPYRGTWKNMSHWWLQDASGRIVDPSADQFRAPFPYQWGKPAGFLTSKPSKRAVKLMQTLDEVRR